MLETSPPDNGGGVVDSTTGTLLDNPLPMTRLADLQSYIPGLIADEQAVGPHSATLGLRGIGSRFNTGNALYPAVAVYLDDIYLSTHVGQNVTLLDGDHVVTAATPGVTFAAPHLGGVIA